MVQDGRKGVRDYEYTYHEGYLIIEEDFETRFPYKIIYTDYDNLSIAYQCLDMGYTGIEQGWVMVRELPKDKADFNKLYYKALSYME